MSIYKTRRALYTTASWLGLFSAAMRGPKYVLGFFWRRFLLKALSSTWR